MITPSNPNTAGTTGPYRAGNLLQGSKDTVKQNPENRTQNVVHPAPDTAVAQVRKLNVENMSKIYDSMRQNEVENTSSFIRFFKNAFNWAFTVNLDKKANQEILLGEVARVATEFLVENDGASFNYHTAAIGLVNYLLSEDDSKSSGDRAKINKARKEELTSEISLVLKKVQNEYFDPLLNDQNPLFNGGKDTEEGVEKKQPEVYEGLDDAAHTETEWTPYRLETGPVQGRQRQIEGLQPGGLYLNFNDGNETTGFVDPNIVDEASTLEVEGEPALPEQTGQDTLVRINGNLQPDYGDQSETAMPEGELEINFILDDQLQPNQSGLKLNESNKTIGIVDPNVELPETSQKSTGVRVVVNEPPERFNKESHNQLMNSYFANINTIVGNQEIANQLIVENDNNDFEHNKDDDTSQLSEHEEEEKSPIPFEGNMDETTGIYSFKENLIRKEEEIAEEFDSIINDMDEEERFGPEKNDPLELHEQELRSLGDPYVTN